MKCGARSLVEVPAQMWVGSPRTLVPNWRTMLQEFIDRIAPYVANSTVVGIFIGECCVPLACMLRFTVALCLRPQQYVGCRRRASSCTRACGKARRQEWLAFRSEQHLDIPRDKVWFLVRLGAIASLIDASFGVYLRKYMAAPSSIRGRCKDIFSDAAVAARYV